MKRSIALAAAIFAATPALAFDDGPEVYEAPSPVICGVRIAHQLESATNCLDWSGKVNTIILWTSSDSGRSYVDANLSATVGRRGAEIPTGIKVRIGGENSWDTQFVRTNTNGYPSTRIVTVYTPMTPNVKEAYVTAGQGTFLRAGRMTDTIGNTADDQPFGLLETFNSEEVGSGVGWERPEDRPMTAIQGMADLGNGMAAGAALEEVQDDPMPVGVISYQSDDLTAHISAYGAGRKLNSWNDDRAMSPSYHAGATINAGSARLRAATAFDGYETYSTLVAGELTVADLTLDLAIDSNVDTRATYRSQWGVAAGASYEITPRFTASAAYRENRNEDDDRYYELAGEMEYGATETITATVGGGVVGIQFASSSDDYSYMTGSILWEPGSGFRSEISGRINSTGAYKTTLEIEKAFE